MPRGSFSYKPDSNRERVVLNPFAIVSSISRERLVFPRSRSAKNSYLPQTSPPFQFESSRARS
jgi:hypothetical protein